MKRIFTFLLIVSSLLFSQNEFQVNTYSDSTQRWPSISIDGNGNYYVVWQSLLRDSLNTNSNIYLQQFNSNDEKIGSEVLVNGYEWDQQEKPVIATNSSGTSIIAWSILDPFTAYNIHARIFNQNTPVGNEINVNTYTEYSQTNPAVAIRDNGDFIVVWDSWFQDGSDRGVFAQIFTADGGKLGMEFKVNNTTLY
ncbi:MAG: hypothetical protein HXY50_01785, partial [Ignavibacteriaceae bacterium]|nr:hypothetical protein [Ignavibacteriaceae bacterium]